MKKIVLIILTVCLTITINAQDNPELAKEIETIENSLTRNIIIKGDDSQTFNILDRMAYYKVPGISIAIVENGKLKWAKGYGMANTNTGTKVDANNLITLGFHPVINQHLLPPSYKPYGIMPRLDSLKFLHTIIAHIQIILGFGRIDTFRDLYIAVKDFCCMPDNPKLLFGITVGE